MGEKAKVEVIPYDAEVSVKISGGFYMRLVQLNLTFAKELGIADLTQHLEEMKTREPNNDTEYNLLTMLTLISSIEKAARDQEKTQVKEIDLPDIQGEAP